MNSSSVSYRVFLVPKFCLLFNTPVPWVLCFRMSYFDPPRAHATFSIWTASRYPELQNPIRVYKNLTLLTEDYSAGVQNSNLISPWYRDVNRTWTWASSSLLSMLDSLGGSLLIWGWAMSLGHPDYSPDTNAFWHTI